jgi:hypothetical protein
MTGRDGSDRRARGLEGFVSAGFPFLGALNKGLAIVSAAHRTWGFSGQPVSKLGTAKEHGDWGVV